MAKDKGPSIGSASLKKFVIEVRYKPTLRAYDGMDRVGLALSQEFPDWQRGPLALEIRNKKDHRRLVVTHNKSFFDCVGPDSEAEDVEIARKSIKTVCDKIDIVKFERFGFRCWFAAAVVAPRDYESFARLIYRKFCTPLSDLRAFSKYTLKDSGYTVDVSRDEWTYGVRVGPMTKDDWFSSVHHERQAFEMDSDGATFEKYADTLPDVLVFFDVDIWREGIPYIDADRALGRQSRRAREIVDGLLEYLRS
jgi:hypothetical protein